MLLDEYKKSLKRPEAEEFFDLVFYRPIAYLVVKGISWMPVTPNQVTTVSLLAGLLASYFFFQGTSSALVWGALWYALANVLDCADGQLARLQQSGTLFGRVWDGVADYISTAAVFLGIGLATNSWILVLVAVLSSVIHAMVFDYYQSEFMTMGNGSGSFLLNEIQRFTEEIDRRKKERRDGMEVFLLQTYVWYLRIQEHFGSQKPKDSLNYRSDKLRMIRLWSFLGPTTNRTLLIVCALFGNINLFLWIVSIAGNLWLAVCVLLQSRMARRLGLISSA